MKFFRRPRTKVSWKYILVIAILAIFVGGSLVWQFKLKEIVFFEEKEKITEEKDDRILVTEENIHEIWQEKSGQDLYASCNIKFNDDLPTTEILYANKEKGVSLRIPYNPRWGSERYKFSPYYEYEDGLSFGPTVLFEACSWVRMYSVEVLPLRSSEKVIVSLMEYRDSGEGPRKESIVEDKINGVTIVEYVFLDGLLGFTPKIEVIGKKYNYQFSCLCGNGLSEMEEYFEFFKSIIRTVQFIE